MTIQAINNSTFGKLIGSFFGKTLAIAFFLTVLSIASYAQSGNLYEARSNYRLGTITAYQNVWRIDMGNRSEIKIYNCRTINATGIACVFTQFKDGRTTYSGESQIYQNGAVYLRWMYDFTSGFQRNINGGWVAYQVR
jgi:hypothetical protein